MHLKKVPISPVWGQVAKRYGVSCRHVDLMGQIQKKSERE